MLLSVRDTEADRASGVILLYYLDRKVDGLSKLLTWLPYLVLEDMTSENQRVSVFFRVSLM